MKSHYDATDALLAYASLNATVDASILMVVHDLYVHFGADPAGLIALMCGACPPQRLAGLPQCEVDRLRGILPGRHAGALKRAYANRYGGRSAQLPLPIPSATGRGVGSRTHTT